MPHQEDWSHFIRHLPIFQDLEESAILSITQQMKPLALPRGAVLYREGEHPEGMYILESGRVRISNRDENGKEHFLATFSRGDILGEAALLAGITHTATATLETDSRILILTKKGFDDFLSKNPSSALYLSRVLSRQVDLLAHRREHPQVFPKTVSIIHPLGRAEHITLLTNFAAQLMGESHRKLILLDLSPFGSDLERVLNFASSKRASAMFQSEDFQNFDRIKPLIHKHRSGMDLLVFPQEMFSGTHFLSIPALIETLRRQYDIVLVGLHLETPPSHAFSIKESFVKASEELILCRKKIDTESQKKLQPLAFLCDKTYELCLEESITIPCNEATRFFLPWSSNSTAPLEQTGVPWWGAQQALEIKHLGRLARASCRLRVGIAMGSGAAYGYTLVGIMKVLEREQIPIDLISGTSMGAILGSFFAAGMNAQEVENICLKITRLWIRRNVLSDINWPWPHGGILLGETVSQFLRHILGEKEFKDLALPFTALATDITTGDAVALKEGKVWQAVRASLSLPIIFRPYRLGTRFLVDGGLVSPVPVGALASLGADLLIAVNLTSKVSERKLSNRYLGMFPAKSPGMPNILLKTIYSMQYQIAAARTDLAHVTIRPEIKNCSWVDFHKAKQIIPLGEQAAEEVISKIKSKLPFFHNHCTMPLH